MYRVAPSSKTAAFDDYRRQLDNDISIVDDGTTVKVTCDGEAQESFDNVADIVVKAGNKDDNVSYSLTSDGVASSTARSGANGQRQTRSPAT